MQATEKFSIQCEHCKKWTDIEGTYSMEKVMRAINERCSHCSKDYGWNAGIRGEGASWKRLYQSTLGLDRVEGIEEE